MTREIQRDLSGEEERGRRGGREGGIEGERERMYFVYLDDSLSIYLYLESKFNFWLLIINLGFST